MRNKTKTLLPSILILLLFYSCSPKNKKASPIFDDVDATYITEKSKTSASQKGMDIQIDLSDLKTESRLTFSEVFDSISFLKLEKKKESLLGEIDKIIIKNDTFFLLDRYKAKSLKLFDKSGKFLNNIGKIGPGPQEQQEITDFFVTDDKIIIYDQFKSRMFSYSHDGHFLNSKKTPFIFNSFYILSDNEYIIHCLDSDNYHIPDMLGYSIFKTDSNFVIHNKGAYRAKDVYVSILAKNNLFSTENNLYYHEPLNDTIFSINRKGNLFYDYIVNFGKYKLPKEYWLEENHREFSKAWRSKEYAIFFGEIVPTPNYLYFNFTMKESLYHAIWSHKTGAISVGKNTIDDMYYFFPLSDNILTCSGDVLIGSIETHYLVEKFQAFPKQEWLEATKDSTFVNFLDDLDYEDNPVLVFYHLK